MGEEENVTGYFLRAKKMSDALKTVGKTIDEDLLVAMIIKGLGSDYWTFVVGLDQRVDPPSFMELKQLLLKYEENSIARVNSSDSVLKVPTWCSRSMLQVWSCWAFCQVLQTQDNTKQRCK